MGHYASEMDPNWGKPSRAELKIAKVEDIKIRNLAQALFEVFDSGSHLEITNLTTGIQVAETIDELIKTRIKEALGAVNPKE